MLHKGVLYYADTSELNGATIAKQMKIYDETLHFFFAK